MPAVSEKQRRLMMMALHSPGKVRKENRSVLSMSKQQLHEFSTRLSEIKKKSTKRKR